jgi:hypothetical protein
MANQAQRQIGGLRRNQQFLYIGLFTLVAVIVWVAGSLFQSQRKTGISSELQKMALPLNPNINTFVIDRIESKTSYSNEELAEFEIFRLRVEEDNRSRAAQPAETTEESTSQSTGPSISDLLLPEPTPDSSPSALTN